MSELLGRVRGLFIADVGRAPAVVREVAPAPAPHVGLICDAGAAPWAGAAVALRLARSARAPTALVCRWQAERPAAPLGGAPGRPAARRLAARLAARDVQSRAAGRLVLVTLDAEPAIALVETARALAAAGAAGAPAVVVVAGPRPAACDGLLAEREAIVVAAPAESVTLGAAAAAGAADIGPPVHMCSHGARPLERALALAGIAAAGELGRAFEPACRAVA